MALDDYLAELQRPARFFTVNDDGDLLVRETGAEAAVPMTPEQTEMWFALLMAHQGEQQDFLATILGTLDRDNAQGEGNKRR